MMKCLFIFIAVIVSPFVSVFGQIALGNSCQLVIADAKKGKQLLTANDAYLQRLSAFERSARLKSQGPVSADEYKNYINDSVEEWTPAQKKLVSDIFKKYSSKIAKYSHLFPKTIYLVRTTGEEECDATGYTRGNTLIVSDEIFNRGERNVEFLLMHELFHVITRANPDIRDKAYAVIGFKKCSEPKLPAALDRRRVTNPDAMYNDYAIKILKSKNHYWVVPMLYISHTYISPEAQGRLFDFINMVFVAVGKGNTENPEDNKCPPYVMGMGEISGFFEQIGRNTYYVIHPEEILADNFALMLVGSIPGKKITNRNIPRRLSSVMVNYQPHQKVLK
ncbi:MAG: hypothetical protein GY750_20340 [Lentisphaerae bacterium]|nr:hypothetical protein [Lentisphaerota bacterium]MCP4103744.1 hypothetical protein [Lentisphaerota bacterium]